MLRCLPLDEFNIAGIILGLKIVLKFEYSKDYQSEWLEICIKSHQIINFLSRLYLYC